jgi:NAD(P)-dependent dehydrogenase (short-subunit alcohol dehydrogenase family)
VLNGFNFGKNHRKTHMEKIAIVTGAGSGVGKAIAAALKQRGWRSALLGRREAMLDPSLGLPIACDIADPKQVDAMIARVSRELGPVSLLVNSAGTNIPNRSLETLSVEDFRKLVDVNLTGAFLCVHAVLPIMRQHARGTIVNIVSDAGVVANAKAGAAYVASKFGLRGLTQSINAEQRQHGIRACAIHPGDIDTPLLEKRPQPPGAEARRNMLQPQDVASCAMLAIELPPRAIVEELIVRPR